MQPQNSLIKFLVDQGFTVFVISWKNPDASMEEISFEDYLTLGPLAALDVIKEITGSPRVNAVGYCIGGTLLSMTLPYLAAKGDETINSATFFVSLQDFADQWFESAKQHKGSWWMDWLEWLKLRSGEQVALPAMGSAAHWPITPAPGTYVLEK